MSSRAIWLVLIALAIAGAGAAAALWWTGGLRIRITQAEIQTALERSFPVERTYLKVITVTYRNPKVRLGSDGRVLVGLDAGIGPAGGSADVSGRLLYDAPSGGFFLAQSSVDRLDLTGIPARYEDKARAALSLGLAAALNQIPLYTLDDADTRQRLAKASLQSVTVEDGAVVVRFGR